MPNPPIRLLIHGASGRMGRALLRLAAADPRFALVAAVARRPPADEPALPWFPAAALEALPAFDVAIDFSLPDGFDAVLALCQARRAALVSGTTGLTPAQQARLAQAAAGIPLAWASNFSRGVALLEALVEQAARALPGWDCDIVEAHHAHKRDAPSGTALTLGAAAEAGGAHPRYASLRAGDIVGEHLVQFTGRGERIELVHRAGDRDIFARGALDAAARLPALPPGRYRPRDLL